MILMNWSFTAHKLVCKVIEVKKVNWSNHLEPMVMQDVMSVQ